VKNIHRPPVTRMLLDTSPSTVENNSDLIS